MFIKKLNKEQQSILLTLMQDILAQSELGYSSQLSILYELTKCAEYRISVKETTLDSLTQNFHTMAEKYALLLTLLTYMQQYCLYSNPTLAKIDTYATILQVPNDERAKLERWANEYNTLMQQANTWLS